MTNSTSSADSEREAFEVAYLPLHPAGLSARQTFERDGERYSMLRVQGAWEGWMARALAVEEPKPQAAIEAFEAKYSRSAEDPASAEMLAIWLDAWEARSIKPQAEPRFFLPDSNGRLHECKTEMLKNRLYGESVVILFGAPVAADKGEQV